MVLVPTLRVETAIFPMLCVGAGIAERRGQCVPTRSVGTGLFLALEYGNDPTDSKDRKVNGQQILRSDSVAPWGGPPLGLANAGIPR